MVADRADAVDPTFERVADGEEARRLATHPDPRRRTREEDVAGKEREHRRQVGDETGDREHQTARTIELHRFAVHRTAELEVVGI